MKKIKTICFASSSSGGHIIPCITLARRYEKKYGVYFFSSNNDLDAQILQPYADIEVILLSIKKFPGKKIWLLPQYIIAIFIVFFRSFLFLKRKRPEKIVSTGGHLSIPVFCAGYILSIPLELWELNAIPGKASLYLAGLVSEVNICFSQAATQFKGKKCALQPYPIRFEKIQQSFKKKFSKKYTLFVMGGSQGSTFINQLIKLWISNFPQWKDRLTIIHQTGFKEFTSIQHFYKEQEIESIIFSYSDKIAKYYQSADLVVSRAGAGALFEINFFQKRAIIIPLEKTADDHQLANAHALRIQYPHLYKILRQDDLNQNINLFNQTIEAHFMKAKNQDGFLIQTHNN